MTRIVIVGGGIMGLATAWALTRRGEQPVVLERFGRGHAHGASHGATRNFNNAYADDHYLDLLQRAREGWDLLGEVDGEPLLRRHGLVTHGAGSDLGGGADGASPADSGLATIARRLGDRGIPAHLLSGVEAAARWPGMRFEDEVLYSPDAGVARAAAAMLELERRIVAAGGEVRWDSPVRAIDDLGERGARVTLASGGELEADVVVATLGAWTEALLPGIRLPRLIVTEETPAHFAPTTGPWPSFNHRLDPERWPAPVYGMPTPGEGVKVGFHRVGDVVDPDERPHRTTHHETLVNYVREWMPGLDSASAVHLSCTYTSTDDSAFVLDRAGSIVVGAGFSGHGFKFAPGVGATLADLALDPTARAAAPFRLPTT
ncbi:FAD-dependent oxidoreductase [Microbacterium imperiale]|uniref:N-methyltryptophan oxidase n=1 Tax=Microbacterium imperiale TaxID=33884 RepID=A0A9W6M3G1_9MICO|nr:FAD-dependent oxidoreductase [Microbacterium imperiale]MBP2420435.1 sarcosine oxidase [Microbacterium imperiale]MDS0200617.1 FAD-dependent oxidoreductase [Microbacterium imperiale]BFE40777.1 N-methyl-L-tryptophan oxidase [Microbacterium imperiale]GLJ79936.1 N-methyltryptophan oxidase [Microbacterium imperiale]